MWGHWDKLSSGQQLTPEEARAIAEYNISRESDFAKGVSTYKQEFERARPIMEALQPHIPMLQQHGIDPGQQIDRYMRIHQTLAMGSPEQKLALLMQVAQDYQIPVQNMFIRGQDGQVYFNEQLRPQAPQLNQPRQPDINALVEQKFAEREVSQAIKDFTSAKDASGNPKYPHYETVRETMAQLLENGSVDDLEQAYQYALRHPRHSDIYEAEQQQLAQKNETEKQRQLKEAAERARRNNISVKSGAPASQGGQAQKGLRAQLSSAWDEHLGGRV